MEGFSVVLQGIVLAAVLWQFRSTHLILVEIARMQEHLRRQDELIDQLLRGRRNPGR